MKREQRKINNLMKYGIDSQLAEQLVKLGYGVNKIKDTNITELASHFDKDKAKDIKDKINRKPVPEKILQRLLDDCYWKCCICEEFRKIQPVIIHHIVPYHESHDNSYDNLVILCPNHHAAAHTRCDIAVGGLPAGLIRKQKQEFIKAIAEWKAGLRKAPVREEKEGWDIEEAWKAWISVTSVSLHSDLVLNGREDQSKKLLSLLRNDPEVIRIQSSSENEAYGFILATLREQEEFACRVLIVKNQAQWDGLLDNRNALILVPYKFSPGNLGYTKQKGHSAVIPVSLYEPPRDSQNIRIEKMSREGRIHALQSIGLAEEHARKVYRDTRGYFDPICRHPILKPSEVLLPEWLDRFDPNVLVSVLLATAWDTENEHDQDAVSRIAGIPYEQFEEKIEELQFEADPPLRFVGNICQVVAKIVLWSFVKYKLTKQKIKRLKAVIFDVLGELDPSYDLPPDERWLAPIKEKTPKYSAYLKSGLADTLALLSTYNDETYVNFGSKKVADYVTGWVKELLTKDMSAKRWYSVGQHIILLAEAAPEVFLDILENHLQDDSSPVIEFIMQDDAAYTNLQWALQTISWNITYLLRITRLLAMLEEKKPKKSTLGASWDIYVGWANNTLATYQQRLQIIDATLTKRHPEVAWKLLYALVPRYGQISIPIPQPNYRDWAENVSNKIDEQDYTQYIEEIIERIFTLYAEQPESRWLELVEEVSRFPEKYFNKFLTIPCPFVPERLSHADRLSISTKLRGWIYEHRIHVKARWAWPKELIDKLEETFNLIAPQDIVSQYVYLFDDYHPHFIHPAEDHHEQIEHIKKQRVRAIHEIYQQQGFEGIQQLVERCRLPKMVGNMVAISDVRQDVENEFLSWLDSQNDALLEVATAYASVRAYWTEEWAKMTLAHNRSWGKSKIINFLVALSFGQPTFDILQEFDEEIHEAYWNKVSYCIHENNVENIDWIMEQLIKYQRPLAALDTARSAVDQAQFNVALDCAILKKALIQLALLSQSDREAEFSQVEFGNSVIRQMLEYIQNQEQLPPQEIAQIEWIYVQFFKYEFLQPKYLEDEVLNNPTFFVQLIAWRSNPDEGVRKENARELLDVISRIPGQKSESVIDEAFLREWIHKVREQLDALGLREIGDYQVGELLAKSQVGTDGIWPHEAIREMLEELPYSQKLESGLEIGKLNLRGGTSRDPFEGGRQERELVQQYLDQAEHIQFRWAKTAKILRRLAKHYQRQAGDEDKKAALLE